MIRRWRWGDRAGVTVERECIHSGDPWTWWTVTVWVGGRQLSVRWKRSLRGSRQPCGLRGHAVHDDGGGVTGLQQ